MATLVKLTRLAGTADGWSEYVNLDHVVTMRGDARGTSIAFGDPGLETTEYRFYAETPEHIAHLAYAEHPVVAAVAK